MKSQAEKSGENITSIMRRAGLSQSELARRMGRHRNLIYKWANGIAKPNLSSALDMWLVLRETLPGLSLSELVAVNSDKMKTKVDKLEKVALEMQAAEAAREVQDEG